MLCYYEEIAEKFIFAMRAVERHYGARGAHSALGFREPNDSWIAIQQSGINTSGKDRASLFISAQGYIAQNVCKIKHMHSPTAGFKNHSHKNKTEVSLGKFPIYLHALLSLLCATKL